MMPRRFHTLDVFTETKLAGNPLAVVHDSEGLKTEDMHAIAREFNLAETVFVFPPDDPVNTARIRIFTPAKELPFAGHPTVGTAVLIATLRAPEMMRSSGIVVAIEEAVGLVRAEVRQGKDKDGKARAARAVFTLPRKPERLTTPRDPALLAAALGLEARDIGFGAFKPADFSAGVPFTMIPIRSVEALAKGKMQSGVASDLAFAGPAPVAAYLYAPNGQGRWHTRMFAPGLGVAEDPATGGAAAAFAGALMAFDKPDDGEHQHVMTQGVEMGRPSEIVLTLDVRDQALHSATIGGAAVIISSGEMDL